MFWGVQNNRPVTNNINKLEKGNKTISISTIDFSTLYTKLPHNMPFSVLQKLINIRIQIYHYFQN